MKDMTKRTDLAKEAVDLYCETMPAPGMPDGVRSSEKDVCGMHVFTVEILNENGSEIIGKPVGKYVTIDLEPLFANTDHAFQEAVDVISGELSSFLPSNGESPLLVAGLGNRAITPDALGPIAVENVLATRHLLRQMPEQFSMLKPVTAVAPGVLAMTGIESGEMLTGIAGKITPGALIAIDALAARRTERLCKTVQISNTGIVPGSGVGNHRFAINTKTMHIPCIAVGVPTVVDAATLAADILDDLQISYEATPLYEKYGQTFVTGKEIDRQVAACAKVIGYAINRAAQPELSLDDIALFLS